DLDVAPGEVISLVGASGAGKSTLASILAGTLEPRHGRVLHGGADLARADLEAVRAHAAIVSQDVHVFRGTLREDLRLASAEASDAQLWEALRRVDAEVWAERLPAGLDTEVGEKGQRLTAEQSQQLALARIALRDPAVLVLDEATADEGSSGARVLERAALEVARGRTAVIVAHRLSQARLADRILVMADGHVVEQGSHDQLVARGGGPGRAEFACSAARRRRSSSRADPPRKVTRPSTPRPAAPASISRRAGLQSPRPSQPSPASEPEISPSSSTSPSAASAATSPCTSRVRTSRTGSEPLLAASVSRWNRCSITVWVPGSQADCTESRSEPRLPRSTGAVIAPPCTPLPTPRCQGPSSVVTTARAALCTRRLIAPGSSPGSETS